MDAETTIQDSSPTVLSTRRWLWNSTSTLRRSKYAFGVFLILLVAVIWVAASEWIQWIFGSLNYSKPYFLTYFNTTGFCFWNLGFLMSSWRRTPLHNDTEHTRLAESGETREHERQPYSIVELVRCACLFCPLWFLANSLFNYSLSMTSVSSNTILSTTSTIWTLALSRLILEMPVTWKKIGAVVLCVGGTVMVALADDKKHGSDETTESLLGDMIALLSAFFYAAYVTVLKWCLADDDRYRMGMVFGFVGVVNLITMWPGLLLLDLLGVEKFEAPSPKIFGALLVNALIGTNLSDVLWAKSVVLTSPLVATLGLSLTTPLAMLSDFLLRDKRFSVLYVAGAVLVTIGFVLSNVGNDDKNETENDGEGAVPSE